MIDGVVPILPAPFLDNEELDEPSLRRLVEFAASHGAPGKQIIPMNGNICTLTEAQMRR